MSASNSLSELDSLECHFTWDLTRSRSKLFRLRDAVMDIGTEDGNPWLGHIYNLLGFLNYKLGSPEKALDFFSKATETFLQLGDVEEGVWLVVNYGNLAWMHNDLGDYEESRSFLTKLETLMEKSPPPVQDELHPEVYAEKAWTLMKFDKKKKLQAADYFQEAISQALRSGRPGVVAWKTSRALAVWGASKYDDTHQQSEILEEIEMARQEDPDNLFLAALNLWLSAERKEDISDKLEELKEKILQNPVSSYSGIKMLIRIYKELKRYQEAIDVTEVALERHPGARFLKRCCALSYKWKIVNCQYVQMINRAISLHEEVVSLYPDSSLIKEIDLATMHAKSGGDGLRKAEKLYETRLSMIEEERNRELEEEQMIYSKYAKFLHYEHEDSQLKSIKFHKKAATISYHSFFRKSSIRILRGIVEQRRDHLGLEIAEFLNTLPDLDFM